MTKPILKVTKLNDEVIWLLLVTGVVNPPWQYEESLSGYWIPYFSDVGLFVEVCTVFNAFEVIRL